MKKVAIVTCRVLPETDPDQELLLGALRDAGFEPSMLPWDDPSADPAAYDLCVLRSCWDYYKHPGSFLKWIERADKTSRLVNPAPVVRWNYNKRYLGALASAGVALVPTVFFERGEEAVLATIMATRRWDDVVIKPSVSASSFRTRRFGKAEVKEGHDFLRELLRDRDTMVQKYMPAVEGEGEKAVVWIDGEFTHAVRKSPRFAGAGESVSAAVEVSPEERALAEQALSKAVERVGSKEPLLYARVDMVRGAGGKLVVSELEMIEPSLFLLQHPPALERLVSAIGKFAEGKASEPEPAEQIITTQKPAEQMTPAPKPSPAKSVERKFIVQKPGGPKPGGRKPLGWKPTGRKSGGRKHTGWKPGDQKPIGRKPALRRPGGRTST